MEPVGFYIVCIVLFGYKITSDEERARRQIERQKEIEAANELREQIERAKRIKHPF